MYLAMKEVLPKTLSYSTDATIITVVYTLVWVIIPQFALAYVSAIQLLEVGPTNSHVMRMNKDAPKYPENKKKKMQTLSQ